MISIVIPVYKRKEWILLNIKRLAAQIPTQDFELVVVDDGSPNVEEIEKAVCDVKIPANMELLFLKKNHGGPAAARNVGIDKAKGDIVCFLDDDSIVANNWLMEITLPIRNGDADIVAGRILSYYRTGLPLMLEGSVYSRPCFATCNISYRREVLDRVGKFDEDFLEPSWEDNDLAFRAIWSKFRYAFNPKAIVYHPHEQTLEEYKNKCLLNGRGAFAFSRKYFLKKSLWSLATPFIMARRLLYLFHPKVWKRDACSPYYLKFLWSWYSLRGFITEALK